MLTILRNFFTILTFSCTIYCGAGYMVAFLHSTVALNSIRSEPPKFEGNLKVMRNGAPCHCLIPRNTEG
jgi:hypothetical protein